MTILDTPRLRLRPFRPEDLNAFYTYAKDPDVGPNAGWPAHTSIEETKGILERFIHSDEVLAITEKASGKLVGSIGLHRGGLGQHNRARELGYVLAKPSWGQGYMTEAALRMLRYGFEELDLLVIHCSHYPFNDRSRRVIEKLGFRYDGTLRQARQLPDQRIVDLCAYSITNLEFKANMQRESLE